MDHFEFSEAVAVATRDELNALFTSEIRDRDPFCFENDMKHFADVRTHLGLKLKADPAQVVLVGSGAMGFSVAPHKFPKLFRLGSDLDFAIISPTLFDEAWSAFLRWGHPIRRQVPPFERQWFEARQSDIFWGWLDPAKLKFRSVNRLTLLNEIRDMSTQWFDTFQSLGLSFPGSEVSRRSVSARLYRSEEHLLQYQVEGLQRLQQAIRERET